MMIDGMPAKPPDFTKIDENGHLTRADPPVDFAMVYIISLCRPPATFPVHFPEGARELLKAVWIY
jgi:hypothetical protein